MKYLSFFLFVVVCCMAMFYGPVFSQDDISPTSVTVTGYGTPNPGEMNTLRKIETPDYVRDWERAASDARHNGNEALAREYIRKIDAFYGVTETDYNSTPLDRPIAIQVVNSPEMTLGDWYNTDVLVYTGALRSDGYRQLAMINGDDGNLYAIINTTTANSYTRLFRSLNRGVTWTQVGLVTYGTNYAQSVNIAYADSGTVNRITALISYGSAAPPTYNGSIWYVSWRTDGSYGQVALVQAPTAGYGFRDPSIITDGLYFSPAATYFFGTYTQCNSSGTTVSLKCVRSVSFGTSWTTYNAVDSTWDDHYPVIDYKYIPSETTYVVTSRYFSSTTAGIRIFRESVYNMGGGWSPIYLTSGGNHRKQGFAVRHANTSTSYNNNMLVTYSKNDSGRYAFSLNAGASWTLDYNLAFTTENPVGFTNCVLDSQSAGSNYAKAVFISNGDSVIYRGGVIGSLGARVKVNSNLNSGVVVPTVSSYNQAGLTCGAIMYAGFGPTNAYYDGECLITGITPVGGIIPDRYSLEQNYPNPFNPITNIRFGIPQAGTVKLVIYDVGGREVKTVVDGFKQAGTYSINFDATSIPSGVYFYKITAGDFTDSKKMMLIK